ncbi:MAG: hypothetical protein GC191_09085 [Azospirillum sp.]|nr:hypothetical protein [Azospirillum sp.]
MQGVPSTGQNWRHSSGRIYTVLMLTNTDGTNDRYPISVVYQQVESRPVWSRPLSDWHRSFTLTVPANQTSERQIEMARHALGLPNERGISYRNNYIAIEGSAEWATWLGMVRIGHAIARTIDLGSVSFWLTESGARAALMPGEALHHDDFPEIVPGVKQ